MTAEPRFRLIEFENGPSYGTDHPAGWLALVDDSGVELWRSWISPTPIEIWTAIGRAADHHARLACDHPRGFGTICDVCGGDVAALMPARLAADPFEHADGAPCSDPWCEDKTKPGPVCDGPWTCIGVNVCDRTDCDRARLAAGTEEG